MPWDPLRDLRAWQERLERLSAHSPDAWTPPVDVYETEDRYVIAAELPGLTRDQIELLIEASRLTIRGERAGRDPAGSEVVHFHQVERGRGPFSRTFEFADKVDVNKVSAEFANGVLRVTLPKATPAPPLKIEVR
ncbi:MAG: hypothetical protein A3H96_05850 [Acidobacteria bacterium RIFCSPLOWO2_02_FULL_67_36]|nr:MAG: hypothetical protein A3H96_05850 [Acidobacteria bacterium RIFCSPLOWO2_02_FULL_67_36]OFW19776.1 MAG: hypothetical protein A3G21_13430 [Acidobacteria bacterium RIFCSPLOWO2_12_FULL_66_21]